MTKKPAHITPASKELGPEPADTTGKEVELVRDWDQDAVIRAMRSGRQFDIIEAEINWLLRLPAWSRQSSKVFGHAFTEVPNDIAEKTLAKCQLDNIPVQYHQGAVE